VCICFVSSSSLPPSTRDPRPSTLDYPLSTTHSHEHTTPVTSPAPPLSSAPEMKNGKASPKLCDQIAHRGDPSCRVVAAGNQSYTAATLVSSLYVHTDRSRRRAISVLLCIVNKHHLHLARHHGSVAPVPRLVYCLVVRGRASAPRRFPNLNHINAKPNSNNVPLNGIVQRLRL
jgi:hypothetical protein